MIHTATANSMSGSEAAILIVLLLIAGAFLAVTWWTK